ncbi:hypothetical protein RDV89_07955 [Nocardioides zeae]|uniref:DUF1772 domain-containing protein n=1 Tax=Nocardioides imazamoxiresistens TaxID=3231893 RepID=A0ABU3PUU1_9ACTN|nr:hypothetical protein [Nocardioides zeae]MDT9592997.1 hypothetical protein [Nocardioides zeae]
MTLAAALLLAATALHLGFQAVVTLVVYPALRVERDAPAERWRAVHDAHSRRIAPLVVAVYGVLALAGVSVLFDGIDVWQGVALGLSGFVVATTAFAGAPLHGALGCTDDPARRAALLRRLAVADAVRLGGAAAAFGAAVVGAVR